MITFTRILSAVVLLFTIPFSLPFWVIYIYCGVSDISDGLVARKMRQQSDLGAKLDSIADVIFVFAALITVVPAIVIPLWIWICSIIIIFIRISSYLIGYKKYHVFTSIHTYANKVTGGLLLCTPVLFFVLGVTTAGIILCLLATLSSCEELIITVLSRDLERDRKSLFVR